MAGKVVHWKKEPYDFYIGRNGEYYGVLAEKNAHLENPFPLTSYTRLEALQKFEDYARARCVADREFRARLINCHNRVLACWCWPLACHGHVILKLAAELHGENI